MVSGDALPDAVALARHDERCLRQVMRNRPGVIVVDLTRGAGWLRLQPGADPGEFASTGINRVYWRSAMRELGAAEVQEAVATLRHHAITRAFMWLSPWCWSARVDRLLRAAGAAPTTNVDYVMLARHAAPISPERPTTMHIRRLDATARGTDGGTEAGGIMRSVAPWFGNDSAASVTLLAERGDVELHAAFDGATPASVCGLMIERSTSEAWTHLGWAGTDPAHRGRGAQSSLIAARVRRAAELGATWCTSETINAPGLDTSFRNLRRCGFAPVVQWAVYVWNAA